MYTKDKSHRITLRVNDEQFDFVKMNADTLGVSPSDFLRMVINTSLSSYRMMAENEKLKDGLSEVALKAVKMEKEKEGDGRENDKADQHNIV